MIGLMVEDRVHGGAVHSAALSRVLCCMSKVSRELCYSCLSSYRCGVLSLLPNVPGVQSQNRKLKVPNSIAPCSTKWASIAQRGQPRLKEAEGPVYGDTESCGAEPGCLPQLLNTALTEKETVSWVPDITRRVLASGSGVGQSPAGQWGISPGFLCCPLLTTVLDYNQDHWIRLVNAMPFCDNFVHKNLNFIY